MALNTVPTGLDTKLYRNTVAFNGTVSPTWSEVAPVGSLTFPASKGRGDTSSRASNWATTAGKQIKSSIEFDMPWVPSDTNFAALQAAFYSSAPIEVLILDRAYTEGGAIGVQVVVEVTQFDTEQPLAEGTKVKVKLEPITYYKDDATLKVPVIWPD